VNALRRIHSVLIPDGLVVDTQPISARPRVEGSGVALGTLDMRAWRATIDAVDRLTAETIDDGLFALDAERPFIVTDTCDDDREFVEEVSGWQGTRVSRALARRIAGATPPISVHQEVRLRRLRVLPSEGRLGA